ncbi:hypothetical protein DERP_013549, partial [Dermatophagoides pteronyssinus]
MLGPFIDEHGKANINLKKFQAVQDKAENISMSSDLSLSLKEALQSSVNRARQLIPKLFPMSDSDSPSHSSLSEVQGTFRDIPMVDVESSTESEAQSASRDFPMEDIEASAEPEILDIEEPGFDEDFDDDVIFINEAEPEEEPEDIVPISSDRVDSEFLMDVKKTLSDADCVIRGYLNYALEWQILLTFEKFAMTNPLHIQPKPFRLDNKKSYYYIPIGELLVKYILNDDLVHTYTGLFIHIVGDNLSVAELLGLRRSFGYAFACRHCGIPHTRLSSLDDTSTHLAIHNSYDSYKNEVNSVLSIKNFASPYGITCRSAFDKLGINGVISTIIAKVFEILKVKLGSDTVRNRFKSFFKIWGWQKIELAVRLVEIFPEMMENPSDYAIYFHLRKVIFFFFRHPCQTFANYGHQLGNLFPLQNFLNVPYSLSKRNQMAQPFFHVVDKIYDEEFCPHRTTHFR